MVRGFPLFSRMPPEDCSKVVAAAHECTYRPSRTIYFEGDPVKQVILLISGCVKLSQTGPQGQEVILRLVGPGESLCAGCFSTDSHGSTAQTMQVSVALVWEAHQFEALAGRFPGLGRNISYVLVHTINQLEVRFREICTEKVASRLANELVRLVNQVGKRTNGHVEIGMSQRDLAQLTGTTLFSVSRLVGQWQELGIVRAKRLGLIILNEAALVELSRAEELDL